MADGKVTIATGLDNTGLKRGVNQIAGSLGGLKSVVGKISGILAAAFAAQKVAQFGAACIQLGSDVAEVQNVVDTSFGSMAHKMEAFADTAITQFGMSKLAAKKTGSTYMAMARGMGIAEGAASDMAIALTGLSGDVASFFNLDQETAAYKLRSIFTGETEALKDLGVVMTQTNLQSYAMANGMNSNIQAMTQAERVALQYRFVVDQLRLASGDFAKTQDSWANQTRILSMQWQEFMASIGQALTTILLPLVKILNTIVAALIKMANTFNLAIQAIFGGPGKQIKQSTDLAGGLSAANSGIGSSAVEAARQEDKLASSTKKAGKQAKGALAAFDELNILQKDTGADGGAGGSGSSGGAGGIGGGSIPIQPELKVEDTVSPQMQAIADRIREMFGPAIEAWGDAFQTLKAQSVQALGIMGRSVQQLWKESLQPFSQYVVSDFVPSIVNSVSTALAPVFSDIASAAIQNFALDFQMVCGIVSSFVNAVLMPAFQLVQQVISDMMMGITEAWGTYGAPILAQWNTAMENLRTMIEMIWYTYILPILTTAMELLTQLWEEHLQPLWDGLMNFIGSLTESILTFWNEVVWPPLEILVNEKLKVFQFFVQVVIQILKDLAAIIADHFKRLLEHLTGICNFLTSVFTGDWERAWQTVKDLTAPITEWFVNNVSQPLLHLWNEAKEKLIQFFSAAWEGVKSIWMQVSGWFGANVTGPLLGVWNSFRSKFLDIWNGITGGIRNAINRILGFINSMIQAVCNGINAVVRALNSIHISIPDWVPGFGGKSFGINLPSVSAPQIPMLAKGAVLPANRPFLAMVGDQKNGTNIEAPLDTIKQAVAEVMPSNQDVIEVLKRLLETVESKSLTVNIGDEEIGLSYDRYEQRRGARVNTGAFANAY